MDNRTLKRLYEVYGKELYLYLYSLCRNQSMAEDLLQEVFCKAILSLKDQHTNMRAWLYMVARNLCFNALKSQKRLVSLEAITYEKKNDEVEKDALSTILCNEKHRILFEGLSALEPRKREIMEMHYFSLFSLKEIAVIMNLSYENVRVLSHRAKQELKKYMEEQGYDIP